MNPASSTPVSTEIAQFLENLNSAWLNRDYESLARSYHPEIVLLPPDAGAPLLGRQAVIDTYKDFHAACSVERFSVTEAASWSFANTETAATPTQASQTTIVHMRFAIDYRITAAATSTTSTEAPLQCEEGMDVYTLQHTTHSPDPTIIWRAQFTL